MVLKVAVKPAVKEEEKARKETGSELNDDDVSDDDDNDVDDDDEDEDFFTPYQKEILKWKALFVNCYDAEEEQTVETEKKENNETTKK